VILILENLCFLPAIWVVHYTHHTFINGEDLRHLPQPLACRDGLYLQTVEVGVPHDLVAVYVKESHLISPHYSEAALDLSVLCRHRLQLCAELLAYGVAALGLLRGDLAEVIGRIIGQVVHVLGLLLHNLLTAEAIPGLAEQVLYPDHGVRKRETLACKFKLAEGALVGVQHHLIETDCDDKQLLVHKLVMQDTAELLQA